jgi:protein O-GlcNAc transferase
MYVPQVSYLGYCGTMGADYMQYMLADSTVAPVEHRAFYQEKVISLPHSYFVNDHRQSFRAVEGETVPTRQQYGLPLGSFVFCNFNQLYKIDPAIFDVWMRLLLRVPFSVLWLLRFPPAGEENILKEVENDAYRSAFWSLLFTLFLAVTFQARKRGVQSDRIIFSDVAPREEHVKRGFLADLFLDTPACNAHTTACDILWSGTPLLTLSGVKMASRVAASLLRAAGMEGLITTTLEEYEELAVALAKDPVRLLAMRRHLEGSRDSSAAFDTDRWVSNAEHGFTQAWALHAQGKAPADIDVTDTGPLLRVRQGGTDPDGQETKIPAERRTTLPQPPIIPP